MWVIFALTCSVVVFGQANSGGLRLKLTDPSGLAVRAPIHIISKANQYHRILATDDQGALTVQRLPYGMYQLQINLPGFAGVSESVDIHSTIPIEHWVQLKIVAQSESVTVSAANTLIDPGQPGSVGQVGTEPIQNRASSIPVARFRTWLTRNRDGCMKETRSFTRGARNIKHSSLLMAFLSPTIALQVSAHKLKLMMCNR